LSGSCWAQEHCQSEEVAQQERHSFQQRLEQIRKRLNGYDEFIQEKQKLEAERLAGANEIRERRQKEELEQEEARAHFIGVRSKELHERRVAMVKAWREQAKLDREHRDEVNCTRETYVRERDRFEKSRAQIETQTEERELGIIPAAPLEH
jgi:hypothetical protein